MARCAITCVALAHGSVAMQADDDCPAQAGSDAWREAPKAEVEEALRWHTAECGVERWELGSLSRAAFRRDYADSGTPVILHCGEGRRWQPGP